MTNYVQEAASSTPLIYGSPMDASTAEPPSPLHWRTFPLSPNDADVVSLGKDAVIGWELKIDDLRGGYLQSGDFARGANLYDGDYRMTSVSQGVDTRFRRHMMLSQLKTSTTLGSPGTALFFTNLNGNLVMGGGSVANRSLFSESSGVPAIVTYTPASTITGLYSGVIGAATNPERLFVCMSGNAIDVHSVAGTSLGSMHANTAGAYGVITTPINASTPGTPQLLIYANNSIYTLPVSSAIGTAPTAVLSGLPNGGSALGIEQVPKNLPLRAYWHMPIKNQSGSYYAFGSTGTGGARVWSTNLEGTDRQIVPLPLTDVFFAALWRRNVVGTDSGRVVSWDGDTSRDLHLFDNRPADANYTYRCTGLAVNDNDLYAVVMKATFSNSSTDTRFWIEQYLPEFDAWLQVSAVWTPTTFGISIDGGPYAYPVLIHSCGPQMPVSRASSRIFFDLAGTWFSQFLPPSGHNPYYLYRATSATTDWARQWETTGNWTSPYFSLPTLEGRNKKVDQIIFGGEVAEGNVQVTINPNEGGTAVKFAGTDRTRSQPAPASAQALFDLLQIKITLTQGSSAYKTPNGLPVTIRGRAYLNDSNVQGLGMPSGL